ncbi:MAG: prephenate dehydratase domain-containing protein [Sandaracinaceae bacterium]|nr:MAG: ACT domain-containing protein [Sandaracinaceae bacterium]
MADRDELAKIREALEAADTQLVEALDARARAVKKYVALREQSPEAYFAMPSAAEVVGRALERAKDFPHGSLEHALREVIGACADMIAPVRVAVLGAEGGFAHLAAGLHFGTAAAVSPVETIHDVFEEVERRRASFGVVPFESSTDGALTETIDQLAQREPRICGEITIGCSYDLMSRTGNAGDVDNVYGTRAALAACEQTLKRDFPRATILDVKSGVVAGQLAEEDHGAAAIVAGTGESERGQLRRVRENLEDRPGLQTRFVVIGEERPRKTGHDRTLLALAVGDGPGSLYTALQPFADRGINLTRIESRPARGTSWRYLFILELDGHMTDRAVLTAVDEVRDASRHLKVLGSFPRPGDE